MKGVAVFKRKIQVEADLKAYEIATYYDRASDSVCLKLVNTSGRETTNSQNKYENASFIVIA